MYVSLVHDNIAKFLDQTKLRRGVIVQGCEGHIQLHQASHIANVVGGVTTNSEIAQKTKLLETIKFHNIGGELTVEGVGAKSKLCQQFQIGQYGSNMSQLILGYVYDMDKNSGV